MGEAAGSTDAIDLSFAMESSVGLWNIIFEGFDQEVVLVSRFAGKDRDTVNTLYRFGAILAERYKDCKVELKSTGIVIRKPLPENNFPRVYEWTQLMRSVCDEISKY